MRDLARRLAEAEATIAALLSGQVDAVIDPASQTPVLLAHAQEALRSSEQRYRNIVETTSEGVWLIDAADKTTFMNRRMAQMLGCEADMGVGRTPQDFLDEDGRLELATYLGNPIRHQTEVRFVRQDGTTVWTLLESTPMFGSAGDYEGTLAMVMDISDRKEVERELVERMCVAAVTADIGMLLTHEVGLQETLDGCAAILVERLGVELAGIWLPVGASPVMELRASAGRAVDDEVPRGRTLCRAEVEQIARERCPQRTDALPPASIPPGWIGIGAFVGMPLLVNDTLVGVVAILGREAIHDATFTGLGTIGDALAVGIERKLVTAANTALEAQLRQSQKMEAVGRLAGGVAHDFNNILSVILTYGQLLLDDLAPLDPARADIEEIYRAGERAAGLTRQLLMFSRQQVLETSNHDLVAVVANMENMLQRVLGEDVELVLRKDAAPAWIHADLGSIEQVIMNLVVNARDAMPTGGRLSLEVHAPGGATDGDAAQVVLSVTDSGCGMDAATQARIFEPFYTTKAVGKGTGLGLSTVFGIVQQSRGTVRVESAPGRGSTFEVSLPRVSGQAAARAVRLATRPPRGSETILLVEDEDQVRAVARAILQRQGYRVIEMRTGAEALGHIKDNLEPIDLLLTDVVMPQMSGTELAGQLLALRPAAKVLCMSGYTDDAMVRHGVLSAEIEFLQKPFTPASLAKRVREVLDEPRAA